MYIDKDNIALILETLRNDLGDGLVASEIWTSSDGLPLVKDREYNCNPKVAPLFNEVTRKLSKTLSESDYPGLGNYYLINLDNNLLAVVLTIDSYRQIVLVDITKIPLGLLMSVALPNLLTILTEITKDERPKTPEHKKEETKIKRDNTSSQKSSLKELLNAFTSGIYYKD